MSFDLERYNRGEHIVVVRQDTGEVVFGGSARFLPELHGGGPYWVSQTLSGRNAYTGEDEVFEYVYRDVTFDENGKPNKEFR